jgi:hypothetical protein
MAKYCVDTSGLSHPYEEIPEDIHPSLWDRVRKTIADGHVAVTQEIFGEVVQIDGGLGNYLASQKGLILHEVLKGDWDWKAYIAEAAKMQVTHKGFISEFIGGSKKTVCLNDLSIIALAKTLKVPVLSMEKPVQANAKKLHIPDVCKIEGVEHVTFSDFCRKENFKF